MTSYDEAPTDDAPTVSVPVGLLQDLLPIVDAFSELFTWENTGAKAYMAAVHDLAPVIPALDKRCSWRGAGNLAHLDKEHEFMHEACMWSIDVGGVVRDLLHEGGHDALYQDA
jgi:hypothetical protein